jgi:hypothetical protein
MSAPTEKGKTRKVKKTDIIPKTSVDPLVSRLLAELEGIATTSEGMKVSPCDDGVSDIPRYLYHTFGINLREGDYSVRTDLADVCAIKVIQNGVELPRLQRLRQLNNDGFNVLVDEKPLLVISAEKRAYVINGNHRLLDAHLRGRYTIPVQLYLMQEELLSEKVGARLKLLNGSVATEFGQENVSALVTSLQREIECYRAGTGRYHTVRVS